MSFFSAELRFEEKIAIRCFQDASDSAFRWWGYGGEDKILWWGGRIFLFFEYF
tara:strand:- start:957 stop:1115 length:159 start_codon:yes stop_codon:yes gene_type:complete